MKDKQALWKRVGAFVRARRDELGLSQTAVARALGYSSTASISHLENGIEGLPAGRAYAWAEVLEVPRDAFFELVTGRRERMAPTVIPVKAKSAQLTAAEEELLASYRRLPAKYQRRLRQTAVELETLAQAGQRKP